MFVHCIFYFIDVGWDKCSYGYHGDDGNSFCSSGPAQPYGPTFTTGDVIGCCLNLVDNICFYTKNGVNLGDFNIAYVCYVFACLLNVLGVVKSAGAGVCKVIVYNIIVLGSKFIVTSLCFNVGWLGWQSTHGQGADLTAIHAGSVALGCQGTPGFVKWRLILESLLTRHGTLP